MQPTVKYKMLDPRAKAPAYAGFCRCRAGGGIVKMAKFCYY